MNTAHFPVTIFHNPDCGTSRNTLAMIRAAGYEPEVVEYLKTGWKADELLGLIAAANAEPRDFIRDKGTPARDLGLLEDGATDEDIIAAMVEHPIIVNRPIVLTSKGVKLCRPSEEVYTLLDRLPDSFTKEDGQIVLSK